MKFVKRTISIIGYLFGRAPLEARDGRRQGHQLRSRLDDHGGQLQDHQRLCSSKPGTAVGTVIGFAPGSMATAVIRGVFLVA